MKKTTSIKNYAKRYHKQVGMTLIELTVVLLILIGLAGLLIPYVGSFNEKLHNSTSSSNLAQLNNAVNRYVAEKQKLPAHVDSLLNGSGTTGSGSCSGTVNADEIYCGLANTGVFYRVSYAFDSTFAESLQKARLSMIVNNDPAAANKTFGTSTGMVNLKSADWTAGSKYFVAVTGVSGVGSLVSGAAGGMMDFTGQVEGHLAAALGRDQMVYKRSCYEYVAFGLGDNNELIQSTATASPVFFPKDADYGPADRYAHLIAIVQVDKSNSGTCTGYTEPAKFMGVVANVPADQSPTLVGVHSVLADGWESQFN